MEWLCKNIIIALLILCFLFPRLVFAQITFSSAPGNSEDLNLDSKAAKSFPDLLKETWQGIVKAQKTASGSLKDVWNEYIYKFLHDLWERIKTPFVKEFKKRESMVQERFKEKEQETKVEIESRVPSPIKYIWGLLKRIF
jgi:hypothetical protein